MLPLPTIKSLSSLIKALKPSIMDDYRAWEGASLPSMQVTIGWNPEDGSWDYQTGDNSYTGSPIFILAGPLLTCIVVVTPLTLPVISAPSLPTWPVNNPSHAARDGDN